MKNILIGLFITLVSTVFGQPKENRSDWPCVLSITQMKETGVYKKFTKFLDYIEESRQRGNIPPETRIQIIPVNKRSPFAQGDAWSQKLDGVDYGIFITQGLLKKSDDLWLENIAQHEICHIALGHLDHNDLINLETSFEYEVEAMICTQATIGENKSIEFLAEYLFIPAGESRKNAILSAQKYVELLARDCPSILAQLER